MKLTEEGLNLIKHFEGCQLKAYRCPSGILTIGYGHTKGVKEGDFLRNEDEALAILEEELKEYIKDVKSMVKVPINDNQFSALVSFAYNCGVGSLYTSTLLRRVNAGLHKEAADQFLRWNKSKGVILEGLTKRREAERALYLKPVANNVSLA